ncbi:hypothetical protein COLO4_00052 [Corchorus olitorius]|uniref:BHLH domain-containing protein n=1 Tax=Corchorus olitorius TaxID=93759 RepID=A0A1R3L4Q7_9ROSI|nr:hypothetical protein COLO4_00052 [Corchorus olitorius]
MGFDRNQKGNNNNKRRRSFVKCCPKQQKVSDKLEALKSLIPHRVENGSSSGDDDDEIVKAEQLFQETADYIVVLKTQVFVLQKLIEIYDETS